jgi:hypothetical protein
MTIFGFLEVSCKLAVVACSDDSCLVATKFSGGTGLFALPVTARAANNY